MSGTTSADLIRTSFRFAIETIKGHALKNDDFKQMAIDALTLLNDRRYNTGRIKRSSLQHVLKISLDEIFDATPMITERSQFPVQPD